MIALRLMGLLFNKPVRSARVQFRDALRKNHADIAQSVELLPSKQKTTGSNPSVRSNSAVPLHRRLDQPVGKGWRHVHAVALPVQRVNPAEFVFCRSHRDTAELDRGTQRELLPASIHFLFSFHSPSFSLPRCSQDGLR